MQLSDAMAYNICMNRDVTSKIVDEIIRFGALGTLITAAAVAPNIVQVFGKPLAKLSKRLDEREYERNIRRETQRVIRYMKQNGYLAGDYEHGLQLTNKARKRLEKVEFDSMHTTPQKRWDKKWRIVIYDVPQNQKSARDALASCLRRYGYFQLQKSTWITPFPCRDDIAAIAAHFGVDNFVTYFEAVHLDNQRVLISRFKRKYPETSF